MNFNRRIRKASDIREVELNWLWEPFLALGKVAMLHGTRGIGKTLFAFRLLAACTNKKRMAFDSGLFDPVNVLYMTNVENLEGIVRPKLVEAGADLDRVFIINDKAAITLADESLEQAIRENNIRLLIIDPVSSYLEKGIDFHKDPEEAYPVIRKLADIAKRTGCAILMIEDSEGLDCQTSKVWQFALRDEVVSYLCLDSDPYEGYDQRELFQEFSRISVEGRSCEYYLKKGKGLEILM